jgi:F-type H+-transporting ATPase subunit c
MVTAAKLISAGLCIVALSGVGVGIGLIFGNLILGLARNPVLKSELFSYAILGFALCEAMGLLATLMAFFLLFAF